MDDLVILRDGRSVLIRPIQPSDKAAMVAAFERLGEDSRYRRFFSPISHLSEAQLVYLTEVDHFQHEALVATQPESGAGVGVARYIRSAQDWAEAEVAVTVVDDWQGVGLGTALLERLADRARAEGVRRFTALVQAENERSLGLLRRVGDTSTQTSQGVVRCVVELPVTQGLGPVLPGLLREAAASAIVAVDYLQRALAAAARLYLAEPRRKV